MYTLPDSIKSSLVAKKIFDYTIYPLGGTTLCGGWIHLLFHPLTSQRQQATQHTRNRITHDTSHMSKFQIFSVIKHSPNWKSIINFLSPCGDPKFVRWLVEVTMGQETCPSL